MTRGGPEEKSDTKMNQSFYIGAVGAQQQMQRLNVQGDNIANVNTTGFKTQRADFTALMYSNMRGAESDEIPFGVGTRMLMTATDQSQGGVMDTGRAQDYMINGRGFFALADLATGEVSFTRSGAFTLAEYVKDTNRTDEEGNPVTETVLCLSDGEGRFVLSDRGGLIEVDDPNAAQPVGIYDYVANDGITRIDDTRFTPIDKDGNLQYGTGTLIQGKLEMSNVDLAEEMTKVIESQRAYGVALKMVQTSDEIESTINGLRS
jgi:flagellar basal-body rod protein FlgG